MGFTSLSNKYGVQDGRQNYELDFPQVLVFNTVIKSP